MESKKVSLVILVVAMAVSVMGNFGRCEIENYGVSKTMLDDEYLLALNGGCAGAVCSPIGQTCTGSCVCIPINIAIGICAGSCC